MTEKPIAQKFRSCFRAALFFLFYICFFALDTPFPTTLLLGVLVGTEFRENPRDDRETKLLFSE